MATADLDIFADLQPSTTGLIAAGSHVLVAYSGGPDSTALLHHLVRLGRATDLQVSAAHFDHGIGSESGAVAERCRRVCDRLGIPFHAGRPSRPLAAQHAELREARYEFLTAIARKVGALRIATAHQADDQAETVLMRILRGTGPRGLAGIPARRGPVVRPLLGLRRAAIVDWLEREGIGYETDPANFDSRWARVRVRRLLVPSLAEALHRDPIPLLLEVAAAASELDRLLVKAGAALLERSSVPGPGREGAGSRDDRSEYSSQSFRLEAWRAASTLERAEALRVWARRRGIDLPGGGTRSAVEFISRGRSGGHVIPTRGVRVSRAFDVLVLAANQGDDSGRPGPSDEGIQLGHGRGQTRFSIGGRTLEVSWRSDSLVAGSANPGQKARSGRVALAVEREHYPLLLRSWRPGDRVSTPAGTRKLKKLFGERSVPLDERRKIPVLVDRRGRVLWVPGLVTASWAQPQSSRADLVIEIADA